VVERRPAGVPPDAAPFADGDGTDSARASLAAFVNGQTGAGNPERPGLNSALDGLDPLNTLAWTQNQGRYRPLWDDHLAMWAPGVTPTARPSSPRSRNHRSTARSSARAECLGGGGPRPERP
jgi:hypothetical protein